MSRRHQPTRRVNPKPSLLPKPLAPGKARCPGCSAVVAVTPNGKLRQHRAPSGEDCAVKISMREVHLDDLPPVVIPGPRGANLARVRRSPAPPDAHYAPKGQCVDCGRWLPGERSLCGRCANHRSASGAACWWLLACPALIVAVTYVAALGVR